MWVIVMGFAVMALMENWALKGCERRDRAVKDSLTAEKSRGGACARPIGAEGGTELNGSGKVPVHPYRDNRTLPVPKVETKVPAHVMDVFAGKQLPFFVPNNCICGGTIIEAPLREHAGGPMKTMRVCRSCRRVWS